MCLSGDKLFGGPQAGIVAGRAELVDQLRHHPLLRALRPDKMQLAALGATVLAYLDDKTGDLPLWHMIDATGEALTRRTRRLGRALTERGYETEVIDGESVTGGGSLPGHGVSGPVLAVRHPATGAKQLASELRDADPPVVARVEEGRLLIDLRTVVQSQDALVRGAFPSLT